MAPTLPRCRCWEVNRCQCSHLFKHPLHAHLNHADSEGAGHAAAVPVRMQCGGGVTENDLIVQVPVLHRILLGHSSYYCFLAIFLFFIRFTLCINHLIVNFQCFTVNRVLPTSSCHALSEFALLAHLDE